MFKSQKSPSPTYGNAIQAARDEDADEGPMNTENPKAATPAGTGNQFSGRDLSLLVGPPRNTTGPTVIDQIEKAERYADAPITDRAKISSTEEQADATKLSIGREIKLEGKISACDVLQLDGQLEASAKSRVMNITEHGKFVGNATVDNADICGRFEGELTVREKLVIRSAGVVTGTVKYGRLEIESGGQLSGDVQVLPNDEMHEDAQNAFRHVPPKTEQPAKEHEVNQGEPPASQFRPVGLAALNAPLSELQSRPDATAPS